MTHFDDISNKLPDHLDDVRLVMIMLREFHEAKERTYKLSFAKRGEVGIWMNLARKYDRIDPLAQQYFEGEADISTFIDTLADLALYSLKWMAAIYVLHPAMFEAWVKNKFCPATGIPHDDVYRVVYSKLFPEEPPWQSDDKSVSEAS